MNELLMLEIAKQRTADQHEAAMKAGRLHALRKALRAQRRHVTEFDAYDLPAIPDYVDGTFRGAEDETVAERTGTAG
jgi:hypothetical protein